MLRRALAIEPDNICDFHIMALAARMGLKTAGLVREQLIKLLKWLHRNKHNVHHVKTNTETYSLFVDTHRPPQTVDKI